MVVVVDDLGRRPAVLPLLAAVAPTRGVSHLWGRPVGTAARVLFVWGQWKTAFS